MNARFVNAPFVCGRGCLSTLPEVSGRRVALFIDSRALLDEKLKVITCGLDQAGISWRVVADIGGEPTVHDALRPLDEMAEFRPDTIVAIGGGSVLDTAKASWVFYEHPDIGMEKAFTPFAIPALGAKAKLIAVPTTSGTGSETTCVAVLIEPDTRTKRLMMSGELVPDLAMLDADLVSSMPASVAAHSGLDALSHALEAAVSTVSSSLVVSIAVQAALDIFRLLPASVRSQPGEGQFHAAREGMHHASAMAGMAINNSCTGLAHALDQIGPLLGLPHGLVCGMLLPHTVAYTSPHPVYARIAQYLGHTGSERSLCDALVDELLALNRDVGLPSSFEAMGIDGPAFQACIDSALAAGLESGAAKFSPRPLTQPQAREILMHAWSGTKE